MKEQQLIDLGFVPICGTFLMYSKYYDLLPDKKIRIHWGFSGEIEFYRLLKSGIAYRYCFTARPKRNWQMKFLLWIIRTFKP